MNLLFPHYIIRWSCSKDRFMSGEVGHGSQLWIRWSTLPETNIAPENGWLEDRFPFRMAYLQGRTVSFREGSELLFCRSVWWAELCVFPKFSGQCDKSYRSQIPRPLPRKSTSPSLLFVFFPGTSFGTGNSNLFARVWNLKHPWKTRWWFQVFFIFTPIWGRFPIWPIFFKGVETTNQKTYVKLLNHFPPDILPQEDSAGCFRGMLRLGEAWGVFRNQVSPNCPSFEGGWKVQNVVKTLKVEKQLDWERIRIYPPWN